MIPALAPVVECKNFQTVNSTQLQAIYMYLDHKSACNLAQVNMKTLEVAKKVLPELKREFEAIWKKKEAENYERDMLRWQIK